MDICRWLFFFAPVRQRVQALSEVKWQKPFLDVMGCGEPIYTVLRQLLLSGCRNPFVSEIRGFLTGNIRLKEASTQEKAIHDSLEVT